MKTIRCLCVCLCLTFLSIGFSASALAQTTYTNTNLTAAVNTTGNNITIVTDNGDYSASGYVISGTGSLTKQGNNTFTIDSKSTYTGGTIVSGGTLEMTTGNQKLTGNVTITGEGSVLSVKGNRVLQQENVTNNSLVTVENGGKITLGAFQYFNNLKLNNGGSITGASIRFGNIAKSDIEVTGTEPSSIEKITLVKIKTAGKTTTLTVKVDENASLLVPKGIIDFTGAEYEGSSITKTGAGTFTISGESDFIGGTTISGGRIIATNASALGTGAVTNNSQLEFNLTAAGEFSNGLSGTGALYKTGVGTLTLSGTNNYSGGTIVSGGTLEMTTGNQKLTGNVTITGEGSVLSVKGNRVLQQENVTNNSLVTVENGGKITLVAFQYFNNLKLNNGGSITGASIRFGNIAKSDIEVTGTEPSSIEKITLVKKGTTKLTINVDNNSSLLVPNGIVDLDENDGIYKGTTIDKTGAGTFTISGESDFIGGTTISGGRIIATNASALGTGAVENNAELEFNLAAAGEFSNGLSGTGALYKTGDGTLTLSGANDYSGGTTVSAGTLAISNSEALGTGVITLEGGTLSTSGAITLNENVAINADSTIDTTNGLTLSGSISGTAALTKTGTGTLTLSGSGGTYSGTTTITEGKLSITNSSAISKSAKIIIESGAEIESNTSQTIHNLNGSGTYTAGGELTINSTLNNNVFNGTIDAGTNNVIFTGDGSQKLSFVPSTTDGTLTATLVSLQSGRLDIKGVMDTGLEITGGVFSPGISVGALTANSFTLNGGTALFEFDRTLGSAGTWDTLTIDSGNITLTSGVFNLFIDDYNFWHKVGEEYKLITGTTGYATQTDLTDWLASAFQSAWSLTGKTDGIYLSAKDTPVAPVPEPSTWALLILGALGMMYFRRKK